MNTETPDQESTMSTENTVILGRRGYGWGIEATLVDIEGEPFAEYRGEFFSACGNCDGGWSGTKTGFAGVYGGVCFQCNGRGWRRRFESREQAVKVAKRRIADRARRARKAAKQDAAREQAAQAWRVEHPALATQLAAIAAAANGADEAARTGAYDAYGGFVVELALRAEWQALTDKQTEAVERALDEALTEQAEKAAVRATQRHYGAEGDKVKGATGVVTVATTVEDNYSRYGGVLALLVIEGTGDYQGVVFKMIGSGRTLYGHERGEQVTVSGTVKKHAEYDGTPQTVLTRTKVETIEEGSQ